MISLILSESALELVPYELEDHPSVVSHAKKLGKYPSDILLDNSWHFAAMKGIKNEIKRGRPDLVHFSILEATSIPLYYQNKLNLFVHTIDNKVIHFGKNVHIPKSYHRFQGVIEELIEEINPSNVIGFSTEGELSSYQKIASEITDNSCIVLGGFQKGHFSDSVQNKITNLYSVGNESFECHVVTSRILYEYEKTIFM
jgi:rRNA small subunit pseudouridine methyltransferase Nep1